MNIIKKYMVEDTYFNTNLKIQISSNKNKNIIEHNFKNCLLVAYKLHQKLNIYNENSLVSKINNDELSINDDLDLKIINAYSNIMGEKTNFYFNHKYNNYLDFGGIAKGYYIETIKNKINDFPEVMINFGGSIFTNKKINVGITNPIKKENYYCYFELKEGESIHSSSSYEQINTSNNKEYSHIYQMDKKEKYIVDNIRIISVIGEDSIKCDAYATALYAMDYKVINYLKTDFKEKLKVIIYYPNKNIIYLKNIKSNQISLKVNSNVEEI